MFSSDCSSWVLFTPLLNNQTTLQHWVKEGLWNWITGFCLRFLLRCCNLSNFSAVWNLFYDFSSSQVYFWQQAQSCQITWKSLCLNGSKATTVPQVGVNLNPTLTNKCLFCLVVRAENNSNLCLLTCIFRVFFIIIILFWWKKVA